MNALERRLRDAGPDDTVLPDYGSHSVSNVPGTVGDVLGVRLGPTLPASVPVPSDGVDRVVVVVLDGLGLHRWRRDGPGVSLLHRLDESAAVTPLTATFPSATASALVTLNTGRTPADHGLVSGNCWLPDRRAVLESLPFTLRGGGDAAADGLGRETLHDGPTVHERLADAGLSSATVVPEAIVGTGYASAVLAGSDRRPYAPVDPTEGEAGTGPSLDAALRDALAHADYTYCYLPHVDGLSHDHGPNSDAYRAGLRVACEGVERALDSVPEPRAERTLVLALADHGHAPTAPDARTDLTADPVVAEALVRVGGEPLAPTGGARYAYLHLRDGTTDRVAAHLREHHDGHVLTREEVLSGLELFGPDPGPRARERCGDVVYLPRAGSVWHEPLAHRSLHGGLSPQEMLVPFAAARLAAL